MSLSTVMQLKVFALCFETSACKSAWAICAVGEDVDEHGGHVWRDHAGAFGDACDFDGFAVNSDCFGRSLGEGVGRHDGAGGVGQVAADWCSRSSPSFATIFSCGNGWPMTPVEAVKTRLTSTSQRSDTPLAESRH